MSLFGSCSVKKYPKFRGWLRVNFCSRAAGTPKEAFSSNLHLGGESFMLLTQVRPDRIDLGRRGHLGKKSRGATSANF
jgi:hypothetical protein